MDDLLSRQVPSNIDAEQWLIGAMLIDSRCVSDVVGVLRGKDFYSATNRNIYETIFSMFSFQNLLTLLLCWSACARMGFIPMI